MSRLPPPDEVPYPSMPNWLHQPQLWRSTAPEHSGQVQPRSGHQRPRPHRDHDSIRLQKGATDLNASYHRSINGPDYPGDLSCAQFGTVILCGAHDCGSEFARVNNSSCFRCAESIGDDYAAGEPSQFGRRTTTSVTIADDEPAISGHALVAPIACNLVRQGGVQLETSACQFFQRSVGAPVERQKSASLARCRRRHLGPLDDDDVDPEASEEVGGAGPITPPPQITTRMMSPPISTEAARQPMPGSLATRSPRVTSLTAGRWRGAAS